jgi:hypothetical protein
MLLSLASPTQQASSAATSAIQLGSQETLHEVTACGLQRLHQLLSPRGAGGDELNHNVPSMTSLTLAPGQSCLSWSSGACYLLLCHVLSCYTG